MTRTYARKKAKANSTAGASRANKPSSTFTVQTKQAEVPDIATQQERAKRLGHNFAQAQFPSEQRVLHDRGGELLPEHVLQRMAAAFGTNSGDAHDYEGPEGKLIGAIADKQGSHILQSRPFMVQAKLTVGAPGDKYEQEADRVAARVVSQINTPAPQQSAQGQTIQRQELHKEDEDKKLQKKPEVGTIQRQELHKEDEDKKLQKKPEVGTIQRQELHKEDEDKKLQKKPMVQRQPGGGMANAPALEASIQQAKGGGQPLSDQIQTPMEQAFGADFSGVKVHTNAQSDQLNHSIQAKAFTTGRDIFFKQGAYNPQSRGGQELIAHELTHVMQQNGGTIQQGRQEPGQLFSQRKEVSEVTPIQCQSDNEAEAEPIPEPEASTSRAHEAEAEPIAEPEASTSKASFMSRAAGKMKTGGNYALGKMKPVADNKSKHMKTAGNVALGAASSGPGMIGHAGTLIGGASTLGHALGAASHALGPVAAPAVAVSSGLAIGSAVKTGKHISKLKEIQQAGPSLGAPQSTLHAIDYAIGKKRNKAIKKGVSALPVIGSASTITNIGKWAYKKYKGTKGVHREKYAKDLHADAIGGDLVAQSAVRELVGGNYNAAMTPDGWKTIMDKMKST